MSFTISRATASSLIAAIVLWGSSGAASLGPAAEGLDTANLTSARVAFGDTASAEALAETKKLVGPSAIKVHNCHQDKKQIHVWRIELPSGRPEKVDDLDVDPANPCPDGDGPSVLVELEDGKDYRIVTTDGPNPDTDFDCREDDPNQGSCQRLIIWVTKSQKDGPVVDYTSG